jgi:hypothetical protein
MDRSIARTGGQQVRIAGNHGGSLVRVRTFAAAAIAIAIVVVCRLES